jgi:hypothetical protein
MIAKSVFYLKFTLLDYHGCHSNPNLLDITNLFAGTNGRTEDDSNHTKMSRLVTNRTLFVNVELKCTWVKYDLEWYVGWCEHYGWPNDKTTDDPQCRKSK